MKNLRRFLLLSLLLIVCCLSGCAFFGQGLGSADLLGGWAAVQGYDATELYFSSGKKGINRFSSFSRGRLNGSGTWEVKGGDIVIRSKGNQTATWQAAKVKKNILTFELNGQTAIFHRIIERAAPAENLNTLLGQLTGQIPLAFSKPAPTKFIWQLDPDRQADLSGLAVKAAYDPSGETSFEDLIREVLEERGFASDPFNVSEINAGYRRGQIVVQIVSQDDPDNTRVRYLTLRLGERLAGTPAGH